MLLQRTTKIILPILFLLFCFSAEVNGQALVTIEVDWNNYAEENRIIFRTSSGADIGTVCYPLNCFSGDFSNDTYDNSGAPDTFTVPYALGYQLFIEDAFGDGWRDYGGGTSFVRVYVDGDLVLESSPGDFGDDITLTFDAIFSDAAPVITVTGDQGYCPGTSIPVVESVSITDEDDTTADEVSIQISSGYMNGEDLLTLIGVHPSITATWSITEGKLTLTGPATLTELEAAIASVEYSSSAINPTGTRGFSISVGDTNFLPSTAHYYEFIADPGITWTDARDAAAARTYYGLQGYLVTLTSQAEADFSGSQATGVGWIGATDDTTEGDWQWVTGPEAGTSFWSGGVGGTELTYAFWNNNEPNDYPGGPGTPGQENFAHITDPSVTATPGSWNDLPNVGGGGAYAPQGYIIEYGGSIGDPVVNVSGSTQITILPAVSIGTQPLDRTICLGCSTTFSVATSNANTFQWQQFNGSTWVNVTNTRVHSGANTATLTVTDATAMDNGNQYRVLVSSSVNTCNSETSNTVVLTLVVQSVITNRRITYRVNKN